MSREFVSLRITQKVRETPDAVTIHFEKPEGKEFNYLPGQFMTLKIKVGEEELKRAYSISTSPYTDKDIAVTVKEVPAGKVSTFLNIHLPELDSIEVIPPRGKFILETSAGNQRHIIQIGAGSGITPLFSMLKAVLTQEPESKVSLLYGSRDQKSIIYYAELHEMEQKYGARLKVVHSLSRPFPEWKGLTGRLDQNSLKRLLTEIIGTDTLPKSFYLCGPNELLSTAKLLLLSMNVNENDIHRESFGF